MARNKAIFDADILINMVKTKSLDYLTSMFEQIYISDYIWEEEIKDGTEEKKVLARLINKSFIILLEYDRLTDKQQAIYRQAYDILKNKASSEYVNEGERRTASFAKAHSVAYYMSDDNKAAPYIKSFTEVAVINYSDLLYMAYSINNEDVKQIADYYGAYLMQFEKGCLPKVVLDKMGQPLDFPTVMAKSSDKFSKNSQLSDFLRLLVNINR
ncbi:MAG: hypothetical protein ACYCYE_11625 [Clostridia bacterium]